MEKYGRTIDLYLAASIELKLNTKALIEINQNKRRQVLFSFKEAEADELKEKYLKNELEVSVRDLKRRVHELQDDIQSVLS